MLNINRSSPIQLIGSIFNTPGERPAASQLLSGFTCLSMTWSSSSGLKGSSSNGIEICVTRSSDTIGSSLSGFSSLSKALNHNPAPDQVFKNHLSESNACQKKQNRTEHQLLKAKYWKLKENRVRPGWTTLNHYPVNFCVR